MRSILAFFAVACGRDPLAPPELTDAVADEVLALEGDPVAGEQVFADNCANCHFYDGRQVSGLHCDENVRFIDFAAQDLENIVFQVLDGNECMPGFRQGAGGEVELTAVEVADVSAYVDLGW